MSTPEAFSLRDTIREVVAEQSTTNPGEMARMVMARIPREHVVAALASCLTRTITDMLGDQHRRAMDELESARRSPVRPQVGSSKVAGYQALGEKWRTALDTLLPTADGRKRLADCTRDDLMFAAEQRRELAAANMAAAARYESYAALLATHSVLRMGDLPETVLAEELQAAA